MESAVSMNISQGEMSYQENGYLEWNIDNFRKVWRSGVEFKSPLFVYLGRMCYISLVEWCIDRILLRFSCTSFFQSLYIEFRVRTESIESDLRGKQLKKEAFETEVFINFTDFLSEVPWTPLHDHLTVCLKVSELNGSVLIPKVFEKGVLSASEKASEIAISSERKTNSKTINKLLEDLKSLRVSGENSDVKLVVGGKEFLAHRIILCTRSPVFKAMLCHDTSERDSGTVNIDDCDPDSFQDFLDYVYTGSTKDINTGNVISLFATSDKYLMSELKEECVSFMKANISVERFCDITTLALLYAEKELLEVSKDFFCKNSKKIIESKNWETFFEENPKEAYEHFMKPLISKR